jgi:hypothetical protein
MTGQMQTSLFDSPTRSFHNTINLPGEELRAADKACKHQEEVVMKCFNLSPHKTLTPAEVHLMIGQQWPITSVRRAITNLTDLGKLVKTREQRKGLYGKLNNCWRLNK